MQRSSAERAASAPPLSSLIDLGHARPLIALPARPARSRPGRARVSIAEKPLCAQQLAHRRAPAPPPPRARACRLRTWWNQRAEIGVEAVGAGEQRLARLPLGHLRLQRGPVALGDVGQVGEDQVEVLFRRQRARRKRTAPVEPEPLGVGARHFERLARGVGGNHFAVRQLARRRPGRSRRSRCRRRAAVAGARSSASSTSSSVSGRGISTRRSTASSSPPEAVAADDVGDRLAPQPPPHHLAEQPRRSRRQLPRRGRRPGPPGRVPSPLPAALRRRAGDLRPRRRASASTAAPSASRYRRSAGTQPTAAVSSRWRFSSAASASVNSERSPPSTPSRLCEVSLIRWSVTRPWGKL